MTAIIGTIVQLFFAWRVYALTRNVWIVGVILICTIAAVLCGIGTAVAIKFVPEFANFRKFKSVVCVWLNSAAMADTVITGALVWHLRKHKLGLPVTDDVIDRVIRLTVQTGMVTAIWAIVDLFVYLFDPTGLHLIFNTPLSKLYTNCLMSTLNARRTTHTNNVRNVTPTATRQRANGVSTVGIITDVCLNVDSQPTNESVPDSYNGPKGNTFIESGPSTGF
jgi:hypothetical protein